MRIGFDAKRAFSNRTGLGNYSRFVIETLANHQSTPECILFGPVAKHSVFEQLSSLPNTTCVYPNNIIWQKMPALWRSFRMGNLISKHNLDVFHGLSGELPMYMSGFRGKKIVSVHDLIFLRYRQYYRLIDRQIYDYKCQNACKQADIIVAISEQTKQDLIQFYKVPEKKIQVVYQDCSPIFKQKYPNFEVQNALKNLGITKNYLIAVGTIEKRKNQLAILKSFALLKNTDLQLVFVGRATGYKKELLFWLASQTKELQSRVLFLENIASQTLPQLYQGAKAAVYLSEFEGFGIPILEALRCGCPVLANDGSSLREVGGESALYAKTDDIEHLANAMEQICENQNLRARLLKSKDLHLQKFEPTRIASQLLSIYQS